MKLSEIRSQFPHTEDTIYLNHAAVSPLSRPVMRAIQTFLEERHRSNIENYIGFQSNVIETKERLARLIHADVTNVEFMQNTSYGLNVLANGLDW